MCRLCHARGVSGGGAALPAEWERSYQALARAVVAATGDEAGIDALFTGVLDRAWYGRTMSSLHLNVMAVPAEGGAGGDVAGETHLALFADSGSLLNHSCRPNVAVDFVPLPGEGALEARFHAARDVPQGSELLIDYVGARKLETLDAQAEGGSSSAELFDGSRRSYLRYAFGFDCAECDGGGGCVA